MRTAVWIGVLVIPVLAFGRTSVTVGGRRGGHRRGGGLSLRYTHKGDHSSFSLGFRGGTRSWRGSRSYWGGYPGSYTVGSSAGYRYPGVYVYRGWVPYSPQWYRYHVPHSSSRGVGPFSYVDAVHFAGTGGVQVFGPPPPGPAAAATTPGPAAGPVPPELAGTPAARLIERGDDLFGRGDFAGAAVAYRAAAAKAPKDPMAAYALGHGLFAVGDYPGAAAALRRGVQLYPGLLAVRMNRRDFYGHPRAFDAQLAQLRRHVRASPADVAARFVLGYNCFFSQQLDQAREQFTALGRDDREARVFLAEIARR